MKFHREIMYQIGMITQLGISMLAPIVLCAFVGYWLDGRFGWHVTIPLLILGILAGARNCWILLKQMQAHGGKKSDDHK